MAGPPALWKEKHLRVLLRQNDRCLALKAWNFAERAGDFTKGTPLDVVLSLEEDAYAAARGYPGWAPILRDVRAARVTP